MSKTLGTTFSLRRRFPRGVWSISYLSSPFFFPRFACASLEGGFLPGPFVGGREGDVAKVRFLPLPTFSSPLPRAPVSRALDSQENHINHKTLIPSSLPIRDTSRTLDGAALVRGKVAVVASGRAPSDHDLLRAPRPRGPQRRLCAARPHRARASSRRVPGRRWRVRAHFLTSFSSHLPIPPYTATSQTLTRPCIQIFDDSRGG